MAVQVALRQWSTRQASWHGTLGAGQWCYCRVRRQHVEEGAGARARQANNKDGCIDRPGSNVRVLLQEVHNLAWWLNKGVSTAVLRLEWRYCTAPHLGTCSLLMTDR